MDDSPVGQLTGFVFILQYHSNILLLNCYKYLVPQMLSEPIYHYVHSLNGLSKSLILNQSIFV